MTLLTQYYVSYFVFRQEMERKRLEEWETQRKNELVQHRQREQEKVLELKAKQEHLNAKLEDMVISELSHNSIQRNSNLTLKSDSFSPCLNLNQTLVLHSKTYHSSAGGLAMQENLSMVFKGAVRTPSLRASK